MARKALKKKDARYTRLRSLANKDGRKNSGTRGKLRISKRQKFATRGTTRCQLCGRGHSVIRYFELCRVCIVQQSRLGMIPGVRKVN